MPDLAVNPYILLSGAILAEVIATTALQYSEGFSNPLPTGIVVIGYIVSFYLLSHVLGQLPIGPVYATWSAAGIVLIATIGTLFLGQQIDLAGVVGIALIIGGVYLLNVVFRHFCSLTRLFRPLLAIMWLLTRVSSMDRRQYLAL